MYELAGTDAVTTQTRPRRTLSTGAKRAVDVVLVVTFGAFGLFDLKFDVGNNVTTPTAFSVAIVVLGAASFAWRRSHPLVVLVVVWAARLILAWEANTEVVLALPSAVALYAFCRRSTRGRALIATIAASVLSAICIMIVGPDSLLQETLIEILLAILAAALAEIVRSGEARTNDRILAETTARVHAERLRLARDLHDVVAHSLSNIAVQSGVAARLIDNDPEHAKKALEIINEAGRQSLDELRSFLGLLRSNDELIDSSPTPDQPEDIDALVRELVDKGSDVDITHHGEFPAHASNAVVLASYRIIQESLTNVARHAGPVPVAVELSHQTTHVDLRVRNPPGQRDRPEVPSTGVGIIGMTERAEAVGGRLTAGPSPDGGFEVHAALPYNREELATP